MCACERVRERGQRKRSLATVKIRCSMQCTNVYILRNSTHRPPLTIRPLSSSSCRQPWRGGVDGMADVFCDNIRTYLLVSREREVVVGCAYTHELNIWNAKHACI